MDNEHQILSTTSIAHSYTCVEFANSGNDNCDVMCYGVGTFCTGSIGTLSDFLANKSLASIQVNSTKDNTKIISIMPIKNTRLASTQNTNFDYGFLTTTTNGEVYYHKQQEIQEKILLGKGVRPHGFLRANGDIVVYMNTNYIITYSAYSP